MIRQLARGAPFWFAVVLLQPGLIAQTPTISVNPTSLSFSAVAGGGGPLSQTISVSNSGGGTLNWSASVTSGSLDLVGTTSAANSGNFQVFLGSGTPTVAGTYSANIRITAAGASNTPKDIPVTITLSPAPTPTISVNPTSLSFSAVAGGGGPLSQTITVSNSGGGTLTWSASVTSGSFDLVGTTSGTNSGSFQVFPGSGTPTVAGTYSGNIRITASGASNTPKDIPVSITLSPAPTPTISVNPTSLSFSGGPAGGGNPISQTISVSNSGGGTLTWSASVTSGAFISLVGATSGTNSGSFQVFVDSSALSGGTFTGNIRIAATGASNTPKDIPVSFTVAPAATPTISVNPTSLSFSAVAGGGGPLSQTITVSNSGGGTLTWSASVTSGSFDLVGTTSGTNSGSFQVFPGSGTPTVAGTYSGNIRITASGASNTPKDIPVSITLTGATDSATLVSETTPENTHESPGHSYGKSWTLRNSGKSTWNSSYTLQYASGDAGCSHTPIAVAGTISPNATIILTLNCTAPNIAGTYREDWNLVGPSGVIPVGGSNTIWGQIVVDSIGGTDSAALAGESAPNTPQPVPGAGYTKTWTLKNNGTTTWNSNYSLQYVSGFAGCGHGARALNVTVAPGSNALFSLACTVPGTAGPYREDWKLVGPSGTIPVSGSATVSVQIVVTGGGQTGPTITSISPTSPVATSQDQNLTVFGSGFQSNLTVDLLANNTPVGHLTGSQIQQVTPTAFVMRINFNGTAGTYAIRVNSPDGGSQSAPYAFNATAATRPQLTVSQASLSFQAVAGQSGPPTQSVIVSSTGGSLSFGVSITYGSTVKWLTGSPSASTTPATLNLVVAPGIAAGSYTATVTISSTSDSTQSAQIQATLAMGQGNLKLGEITMVDPVPSLLGGPGVSTDVNILSSGGTKVNGVAADGVAQVVLKIPSSRLGEIFTIRVINDLGTLSTSSDLDGGLLDPGGGFSSPPTALTVKSKQTIGGYEAFVVYRAPQDFARPGNTNDPKVSGRSVTVTIQSVDGPSGPQLIRIIRPPVLLVHGIWSEPATWDYFCPDNQKQAAGKCNAGTDGQPLPLTDKFVVYRADYRNSTSSSFELNAANVLVDARRVLKGFKQDKGVAAVQLDVVAHSMGGNIVRTITASDQYLQNSNYNSGNFHKLVTVDTPHLGSEFAKRLTESNDSCKTFFGAYKPIGDSLRDLIPGSAALLKQGRSIPTHAIGAIARPEQTYTVEYQWNGLWNVGLLCPSLIPLGGGFSTVFSGAENDLIVSINSQLAAGGTGPSIPSDTFLGAIHAVDAKLFIAGPDALAHTVKTSIFSTPQTPWLNSVIGASSPIPQKVIDVLNSWVADRGHFDVFH